MQRSGLAIVFAAAFFWSGCDPVPVQYPPGSTPYPPSYPTASSPSQATGQPQQPPPPQPNVNSSERWQYAWSKGLEGFTMGGAIGGPYGAGGGLIIGLLAGLLTADAHYQQVYTQVQTEQAKDKELEAQLEEEIERQRQFEIELAGATEPQTKPGDKEILAKDAVKGSEKTLPMAKKGGDDRLASLGKKAPIPAPLSTPFKNVEIKDVNQDGVPDLWVYYNPQKPGEIVRQEEDTNGDGTVDAWSTFNGGKLVRREVDSTKEGRPDVVFYYENDKIVREERDEKRDGRPTFRALYRDGRLARVEREVGGRGSTDLWITYDTTKAEETLLKEERDLDGDGSVDLWSYYEAGRLVRRDVSASGLEILSKQGQSPTPATVPQTVALPDR
jgi:hypothetical protein